MPARTSETGTLTKSLFRNPASLRRSARGFTLIEILVVMVLIALLAGVVAMTIGEGNQRRELANEAKRFHAVLRMAADEAIFQNVEIGVVLGTEQYEFLAYNEEKSRWEGMPQNFLKSHQFPDWIEVEFNREEQAATLPVQSDDSREEEARTPQFMLLSSGESTPFRVRMSVKGDRDFYILISSDGINEIQYVDPTQSQES